MAGLTAPLAALGAAWLVDHFQSQNAAIAVLNQREQSESSLRATMFRELVNPVIERQPGGDEIQPARYALLAELLLLNFHEHFEFKSLLFDADRRPQDAAGKAGAASASRIAAARRSLRSVARRVIDRQIAVLGEDRGGARCTEERSASATPAMVEFELHAATADVEPSGGGRRRRTQTLRHSSSRPAPGRPRRRS